MMYSGFRCKPVWLLLACFIIITTSVNAQSLIITSVDPSGFPVISSTLYALDSNGHRLHPDSADIAVFEEQNVRRVISISCPPDTVIPISSVLTIDVSGSMQFGPGGDTTHPANIITAKSAARAWVRWLPVQVSECAITSFDQDNYLNCDFTSDTATIGAAIDALAPQGGTDYNKALLDPFAGALQISKNAKHPPVIVFLTDGLPNQTPDVARILAEAAAQHCVIYAVTIGLPAPQCLYDITSGTGGKCYSNIGSPQDAMRVYQDILLNSGALGPPCVLKWKSGPECSPERYPFIKLVQEGIEGDTRYTVPLPDVALILRSPETMHSYNKPPGVRFDTTIFITAINDTCTITKITCTNPAYSVAPDSMIIPPGDTVALTLSIVPPDSGYTWTEIDVTAQPCSFSFYASDGYCGVPPKVRGLRLINPNGGEIFDAGSEVDMNWTGMSPDDPVTIDYSVDSGASWIPFMTNALHWYAIWPVPFLPSTRCWMRVQHYDDCGILQRDTSDRTWTITIPKLTVSPINCGDEFVGMSKDTMIFAVLFDPGMNPLTIDSITFSGSMAGEFALASATFPMILASRQWTPLEFRFSPADVGFRDAIITFHFGDSSVSTGIQGIGVQPYFTYLSTGIDFGKVFVGEPRDTLQVLTVRYNGDKPVWIIDARIGTPNDTDFTLLTPIPAHAMLNGDTMRADLRFLASFKGRTSSTLIIRYDGPNSPLEIPLYGEGILPAGISAATNTSPTLSCASDGIDSVRIFSTGKNDLEIYSVDVSGVNANDFLVDAPFNRIVIAPGDSGWIFLRFNPTGIGTRTATLYVHSNSRIDSVFHIALNARKDSVGFSVDSSSYDVGVHCPEDPVASGIPVTNTGSVSITISASVAGGPPVRTIVQAGEQKKVSIDFTAPPNEGEFGEDVILTDGPCGMSKQVQIAGIAAVPHASTNSISLDAVIGGTASEALTVINTGKYSWTISALPDIYPFAWIDPPAMPLTLAPNGQLLLTVGYTPSNTTPVSTTARLFLEPCNISVASQLNGTAGNAAATFAIRSNSGDVGTTINLPIVLNSSSYIAQSHAKYFYMRLRYFANLLAPVGSTPAGHLEGNDRVIDLQLPAESGNDRILSTLQFVATLCQDTITPLHLESATSDVGDVAMATEDGQFVLTGLCHAYGTRLINPNGNVYMQSLRPNPSAENASVDISTTETGRTQLYMIDLLGREVGRFIDGEVQPGISTVQMPTRSLPNGIYQLILQTPTQRMVKQLGVRH